MKARRPQGEASPASSTRFSKARKLDSKLYDLPPGYHDDFVERIGDISLEQANAAVRARIPCDNLAILVLGTKAALGQTIDDAIEGLSSRSVVPHDQELVD